MRVQRYSTHKTCCGERWRIALDDQRLSCGLGLFGSRSLALRDFRLQRTISGATRDLLFAKPMESRGIATSLRHDFLFSAAPRRTSRAE